MKAFLKGLFFGALLVLLNRLCYALFAELPLSAASVCSAFVFFIPVCLTLTGKNLTELFACGFTGVFVMFFAELCIDLSFLISDFYNGMLWLYAYIGGFWGSCAALAAAIFLTVKKISLFNFLQEVSGMTSEFSKNLKIRLLVYAVLTAMSFSYTVMPESSALGVPVFALIQFVLLWFTVPNRRRLFLYVPIFAMALNSFISASTIWHVPNFIISAILLAAMFTPLSFRGDSFAYISAVLGRAFSPFSAFPLPFKWVLELNSAKAPVLKRIALSLAIALPCAALLIFVLSNADMVFSLRTEGFLDALSGLISLRGAVIILGGVLAGLYLFGALCRSHASCPEAAPEKPARKGDLIIINTLLAVCLVVYTLFVIIQFKYLFAGSALPDGITYSDYARKGFFELLGLTAVNIAAIIAAVRLTKAHSGAWRALTRALCHYLCAVTLVLLASSFYRMHLYTASDGLTRLRFFVIGFLFFEAVGLLITFFYIARSEINITLVYFTLALVYYSLLNLVPADRIIAQNQVDMYLNGERLGLSYVYTLSADAAPALEDLYERCENEGLRERAAEHLAELARSDIPERWQRINLSTLRAEKICSKLPQ